MYSAASRGQLEIVQFLSQDGGAHTDIRKVTASGDRSPLFAALYKGHFHVAKWLILNKALSSPRADVDGGGIDDAIMRRDLRQGRFWRDDNRLPLLSWVQTSVAAYASVHVFLTGTIVSASSYCRHPKNQYATRSTERLNGSPLVVLKGKSGILELVAKYAGYPTAHELRIYRQLMDRLPTFIAEVPFIEDGEEDEDE